MEILVMGNPKMIFYVFSGIAMVMKSAFIKKLIALVSITGLTYLLLKDAFEGRVINSITGQLKWLMKYAMVSALILIPVSEVIIKDSTGSLLFEKVDNVPHGSALPAAAFTNIGYALTSLFEKVYTPVDYLPYHKYGLVFGSELVAETRNLKITDGVFWSNMQNFISQCVEPVALEGLLYTAHDLRTSGNIWELVTKSPQTILMMEYSRRTGEKEKLTCKDAILEMNKEWAAVSNFSIRGLAAKIAGHSQKNEGSPKDLELAFNNAFKGYLTAGASLFGGSSAQDIIRQQMMINAVKDTSASLAGTRAVMAQVAGWVTSGEVARKSLHNMRNVLEAIVYSCSIFVFILMMLPGGLGIFFRYMQILLWLQLWAPLYAVLNMITHISMSNFSNVMTADGIGIENVGIITSSHQEMAAICGYFSLAIPFIAKAIIDNSGQGLVHLAGSLTSSMQAAAVSSTSEAISGNLSLDNRSIGNTQYGNTSMMQANLASSFRAPSMEIQGADGAITKYLPNGDVITQSGAGLTASSGHTRINTGSSFQGSLTKGLTHHMGEAQNVSHQLETAEQTTFNKSASHLSQLAERKTNGENIEFSKTSEEGRAVNQALETARDLHDNYEYTWDQAGRAALNASLTGNVNVPLGVAAGAIAKKAANLVSGAKGGGDIGVGLNVGASAGIDLGNTNRQSMAEQRGVSDRTSSQKSYNDIVRGLASESFSGATHEDQQYSEDISKSYQNVQSKRDSLNHHIEKGKQYSDALTHVQTNHAAYDHDAYDDMQKWMMKKGVSRENARIILDSGNSEFQKYFTEFTDDFVKQNHLMNSARNVKPPVSNQEFAEREKLFNDIHIDRNMEDLNSSVKESANKAGLDVDNIKVSKEDISRKVKGVQENAVNNIASTEQNNQTKQENLQAKVDKEDSKRWVNSKIIPDFLKSEKVFGRKKDKE